jgi:predicted Rossmann fold nucleotide-binding protein DprA/Smf involved in DNA uptake
MLQAVPPELRAAVADGRLLLVSSFPPKVRRATAPTAAARNRLVADLAAAVFVPHAAAGSKIEALCHELLSSGKRLFTFEHAANTALLQAGAQAATPETDWKQVLEAGRTTPANAR